MSGMSETSIRLLGDGYEPHVDAVDGRLVYSLPVDSGFVSRGFSFGIGQQDFKVLQQDSYRRAVLETIAHTVLQQSMIRDNASATQAQFSDLVAKILHGAPADLEQLIAAADREHNIGINVYVDAVTARRANADDEG